MTGHPQAPAGPGSVDASASLIRFGPFEANLRAETIRRDGTRVRLQQQPFQLLAILLERPGDLVTREELRERLWPDDLHVDFEHSLNSAVKKIRFALHDSIENPRYIETVRGRGYRFVAPVEHTEPAPLPPHTARRPPRFVWPAVTTARARARRWGAVAALAVAVALGGWLLSRRAPDTPGPPVKITPFTADGGSKARPRFSPDGEKVAYEWAGPADDNWDIYVKGLGAGATPLRLTDHPDNDWGPTWSPDGRRIAFVRWTDAAAALYTVPSLGGQERKLIDLEAPPYYPFVGFVPTLSWSPDGEWLTFSEREAKSAPYRVVRLSLATLKRQVLTSPPLGSLGDLFARVSPDGRHLAFVRSNDVWVQRVGGGPARRLTSRHYVYCLGLAWAPDGDEIFYSHRVTGVALGISRVPLAGGEPRPLAGVGPNACWPTIRRGRLVYRQEVPAPSSLWRTPARKALHPDRAPEKLIASSQPDYNPDYSPDGRKIAFGSERSGVANIWVCESDGTNPVQLTRFESYAGTPRWSPGGRKIVFDSPETGNSDVWLIDAEGGIPRPLTHETSEDFRGSWSRDGQWIYFVSDRAGTLQTWKMPAEGGAATQVTRDGGNYARESWDGRDLYYTKGAHTGIWRVPVDGGEEVEVLPGPIEYFWDWALVRDGIYFATVRDVSGRRQEYRLQFLDLSSGDLTELYRKEGPFFFGSLAVSPDEQWILHGESPLGESELMLVENFR